MTTHEESTTGSGVDARRVMLARHCPGKAGETACDAHLFRLPLSGEAGAASAACGWVRTRWRP